MDYGWIPKFRSSGRSRQCLDPTNFRTHQNCTSNLLNLLMEGAQVRRSH